MLLLLIANTLNIAADVAAMGEVAELVTGFNRHLMTAFFVVVTLLLQVFVPYHRYVSLPEVADAVAAGLCGGAVHRSRALGRGGAAHRVAHFKLNSAAAAVVVGVFGTTISPYLFFWQASEEVEDMHATTEPRRWCAIATSAQARNCAASAGTPGAACSTPNLAAYFIILATGRHAPRRRHHRHRTAAQAASALRPLAGNFAFVLFALGILGVGLIGVPVLAGSGAYALAEAMGWKWGLERKASDARGFYGVIAVSVLAGLVIQYSPISPMKALFWSAVINGVVAVPLMVVIILLVSKKSVMGAFTASRPLLILGWIATAVMGAAAVRMFIGD